MVLAGSCIRSVPQILLIWREKRCVGGLALALLDEAHLAPYSDGLPDQYLRQTS